MSKISSKGAASPVNRKHLEGREAAAVAQLSVTPEWALLEDYLRRKRHLLCEELETIKPGDLEKQQGRLEELKHLIELPVKAQLVLDGHR